MSFPYEAVLDYREFGICPFCDYAGIGTVTVAVSDFGPDVAQFDCDICGRSHDFRGQV
jgi:hypothetical protein